MQTISDAFAAWAEIEAQFPVFDDETVIRLAEEKGADRGYRRSPARQQRAGWLAPPDDDDDGRG